MDAKEPIIHSHITDCLKDDHSLAYTSVYCRLCDALCHASNNECMQTWAEYNGKNYCGTCFAEILLESEGVLGDE